MARALVCDYTDDPETYAIDQEYLLGDALLIAPLAPHEAQRQVYLPGNGWFDFWTEEFYVPGWHTVATDRIPVFVRRGSTVPMAQPLPCVGDNPCFDVELRCYGDDARCTFVVDDGVSYSDVCRLLETDREGRLPDNPRYRISSVRFIGSDRNSI